MNEELRYCNPRLDLQPQRVGGRGAAREEQQPADVAVQAVHRAQPAVCQAMLVRAAGRVGDVRRCGTKMTKRSATRTSLASMPNTLFLRYWPCGRRSVSRSI